MSFFSLVQLSQEPCSIYIMWVVFQANCIAFLFFGLYAAGWDLLFLAVSPSASLINALALTFCS